MAWIPKQSNFFFPVLIQYMTRFIRKVSLLLFFLAFSLSFFLPVAANAQTDSDFDQVLSSDDFSDHDAEDFALRSFAVSLAAAASSGNITNDVAAILDLLTRAVLASNGRLITVPYSSGSKTLADFLAQGLGENWTSGSTTRNTGFLYEIQRALYGQQGVPNLGDDVISQLRRMSNVWTRADVQKLVASSNVWTRDDVSYLLNKADILGNIDSSTYLTQSFLYDIQDVVGVLNDSGYTLSLALQDAWNYDLISRLAGMAASFNGEGLPGANTYSNAILNVMRTNLMDWGEAFRMNQRRHPVNVYYSSDAIGDLQNLFGDYVSPVEDTLEDIYSWVQGISEYSSTLVGGLAEYTGDFAYFQTNMLETVGDILNLNLTAFPEVVSNTTELLDAFNAFRNEDMNYPENRSVASDFRFLHQQLGFENPTASNSLAGVLARFFDMGLANSVIASNDFAVASITNAEVSLTNVVAESERASENVATNSPDFEEHQYTGSNPIDTGDNIFDLPERQFSAITPDLPESSDSTIVIYDGNFPIFRPSSGMRASSLSSSPVRLNISYALRDNDDVSSGFNVMRSIMEFVWDWVFLILSVAMLFSFYKSLSSRDMVNSGVGGLTLN